MILFNFALISIWGLFCTYLGIWTISLSLSKKLVSSILNHLKKLPHQIKSDKLLSILITFDKSYFFGLIISFLLYWQYLIPYLSSSNLQYLELLNLYLFIGMIISIIISDFKYHLIPNSFIFILFCSIFVFRLLSFSISFQTVYDILLPTALMFAIWWATLERGMGMADVKLALVLGLWLGALGAIMAIYIAFLIAGAYGILLYFFKKLGKNHRIAFGPFLLFGAVLVDKNLKSISLVFELLRKFF